MAGVMNNTARQYNLKVANKKSGNRQVTVVRLKPGFNSVPDKDWNVVKSDPYTKALKDENKIVDGSTVKSPKEVQAEHRAQVHKKFKSGAKKGGNADEPQGGEGGEGGGGDDDL